jgi:hypothetical protein
MNDFLFLIHMFLSLLQWEWCYFSGWCGEVRDVKYSDNGSVTVVYRVTIRGTDGEVLYITFNNFILLLALSIFFGVLCRNDKCWC